MLRLLLILCASLFVILLIGGEDYGQRRPGLEMTGSPIPLPASPAPQAAQPVSYTPESEFPVVLPLIQPAAEILSETEAEPDIRYITAQSVNVREGPSTEFPVVARLRRGEATRVMWTEENGWARIVIEGDGVSGFISGQFLSPTP